ncbi:hypothetical protein ACK9YZ_25930 [Rhizobium sp. ZK1]|uniref:hypothetical protein n=1 Tax=Rhizobium sp. ZK1 TaxID=3389872 RepID=UPI0039F7252E
MANARTTFHEVISEIEALATSNATDHSGHWTVEYLTRREIFYQFSGNRSLEGGDATGHRFDGTRDTLTALPANLLVPAIADFANNTIMAFYIGASTSVAAIAREAVDCSVRAPEVLLVDITIDDEDLLADTRSLTRLAFVGLDANEGWSPLVPCADVLSTSDMLHPFWCHGRQVARRGLLQIRI